MADVSVQLGYKDSAWFIANATLVLLEGQKVHLLQTGTYKLGDGITQLSALSFLGGATSVGFSDLTGNPTDNTSLATALNSKANDNSVVHLAGLETISGLKTFNPGIVLTDSIDTSASDVNTFRLQSFNQQGFSVPHIYDAQGNAIEITRDGLTIARNVSGISYTKGQVVYVSGSTGAVPQISLAKANSLTTLGVIGVCYEDIAINGFGRVMIAGNIEGLNLSAFSTGDTLYVSPTTSGLLTSTKPTYPNYAQLVGFVLNNGNGNGILNVSIRGVQGIYNGDSAVVSDITSNNATASTVPYFDSNKKLVSSSVTPVTLSYLDATSSIQTQINSTLKKSNNLSDVTNAQTSRTNLGLETGANGGNANYSIGTERLAYTGTPFTAAWRWTLPDSTGFNALHEKIVADILQTITSINTLTVGVQSGKKLNGVTNGTVVMTTPGAARRFWPDGSGGWCYDAGLERVSKRQNFYSNVTSTTTGSTSETVVANIPITANAMGANGWMDIDIFLSKSASVGNCTWKVYLATVGTFTVGSTSVPTATYQIGQTVLAATTQAARFFRRIINQNSNSSQIVYPTTAGSNTDIGNSTSSWSTRAIDTSAATWLVITVTASNASDTLGIQAASASTTYNI